MNKRGEQVGYSWSQIMVAITLALIIIVGLLFAVRRILLPYIQ